MSREFGSALPYTRELEVAATALPLGFVVSQEWGNLHVTQAASEAYAMLPPVTAGAPEDQPHTVASGIQHDPQIDIWLIGPRELSEPLPPPEEGTSITKEQLEPTSEFSLHDKGVAMTAEFGQDKQFMTQLMALFFEHKTGHEVESIFSYSPSLGTGQPLLKDIEEMVPHIFAHVLSEHIQETLPSVLYSRERLIERQQALGIATRSLAMPPLCAGAAAAAAEIGGSSELVVPLAAIIAAGAAAFVVRSGIKTYLSLSGRMDNSVRDSAQLRAMIVGSRIEEAFKPQLAATDATDSAEGA